MTTITTRAGKGAPLTNAELDANFTNLNSAKLETTATTSDVAEGTRLYFTDARARAAISATGSLSYNSTTGVISFTQGNSDTVSEGATNLYFTEARARASVSAGTGLSYNASTGVMTSTITQYTDALARAALSVANGSAAYNSSTGVITVPSTSAHITESGKLFYTDARARASVSAGTGISYNSTTGVITSSITQYTDALARASLSFAAGSGAYNSTTGVITIPTNTNQLTNGSSYITAAQTYFVGTTSNALNRASGAQTLTGVSIDGNAATVTNGVYTTGDQTINGSKTFGNAIRPPAVASSWIDGHRGSSAVSITTTGTTGSYHGWVSQRTPSGGFSFGTLNDAVYLTWGTNANINAGTNSVSNAMVIDSALNATFGGNVTAYSDERLKKDWVSFDGSFVDRLADVQSGTFTRIDTEDRQAGVSAQSLQRLIPEAVHENEDGILSVAYGNAAMVSAIELAKEIRALKAEIAELKGQYGN